MIINSEHKFFFLHNPKVAGTSIRRRLFEYDDNPRRLEYQSYIPDLERVVEVFHVCVGDISAVWPNRDFSDYFKFGFVRDPYDRLFSSWAEHKRQHKLDRDTDFNAWAVQHLTPSNVRFDWRYTHFCPQHYFFYKNNELYADFIGRYEHLEEGWHYVQAALGVEVQSLGHSKDQTKYDTGPRLTINDLSPQVLGLVNTLYRRDFELFGYRMIGPLPKPTLHADIIDQLASPLMHYSKDDDIRYLDLGQQCAYWRNRALRSEAKE
jgi:hypothetical protein